MIQAPGAAPGETVHQLNLPTVLYTALLLPFLSTAAIADERAVLEAEQVFADFLDAYGAVETIDSGLVTEVDGSDRATWQKRRDHAISQLTARLKAVNGTKLAPSDARLLQHVPSWSVFEPAWQEKYLSRSVARSDGLRELYSLVMLDVAWGLFEIRMLRAPATDPNALWTEIASGDRADRCRQCPVVSVAFRESAEVRRRILHLAATRTLPGPVRCPQTHSSKRSHRSSRRSGSPRESTVPGSGGVEFS